MSQPHLLTFPSSSADLDQLGQLGFQFDLVTRGRTALTQPWLAARAAPACMRPVTWSDAVARLGERAYDAVVCHRLLDLTQLRTVSASVPTVLRANPELESMFGVSPREAATIIDPGGSATICVFDSEGRRAQWQECAPGDVIRPGLDVADFGPYTGDLASVLVMGHLQIELPLLSGYDALERVTAGLPLDLLGFNPALGRDRQLLSRRARVEAYRRHRLYLNTSIAPFGDAANLAVLEAMASGAPVVSRTDPASPVDHGVTGFVGDDPAGLRLHVLELLEDRDLAARLGQAARGRIERDYPAGQFQTRWQSLLGHLIDSSGQLTQISA